jgi:hypothetical protein
MVVGPTGDIGSVIELRDCAAKKNSGRLIPIHPRLHGALTAWRKMTSGAGPISAAARWRPPLIDALGLRPLAMPSS